MKTYAITGVCGYIGMLLAKRLSGSPETRVIGLDLKPKTDIEGIDYFSVDIRDEKVSEILSKEKVDTVIHLAFYTPPEGNPADAHSVNVEGTSNMLAAIEKAGVKRLVLASSAAAYGSHEDNPKPLKESDPLRANDYFYYSAHKAKQEEMVKEFASKCSEVETIILRPCVIIGPHINNPTGDSLKQKLLINMKAPEIPVQLVYETDVAEAFYLAATSHQTGVYNLAGDGTMSYQDIGKVLNKKVLLLPFKVLSTLASIAKVFGLSPVGGTTLRFIKNPLVLDPTKFNNTFGFKPKYDTRGAIQQFAAALG